MALNARRMLSSGVGLAVMETLLTLRALLFLGRRHVCPCCGWSLRTFTHGGASMRPRPSGYCPRCNAKARHRRDWLFLKENTGLFTDQLRLLHVAPKFALSRRFAKLPNLEYQAVDIVPGPYITLVGDVTSLPLSDEDFDAVICIHVLEHVAKDRTAIDEIYRVLRPGGWALISVPIRLDQNTYEDSTITSPAGRKAAFGETSHVRFYGRDLADRLEAAGFEVTIHKADALDPDLVTKHGLLRDENVFLCSRPVSESGA
jgi:SAM-dependent methyltransferase